MRKGFLLTSALVATGILCLGKDTQAQTKPSNPIQLKLGGFVEQAVGYAFQRPDSCRTTITAGPTAPCGAAVQGVNSSVGLSGQDPVGQFDQQTESEIHIIGDGRLDNGLVIRAVFEIEVSGSPGQLYDEAYLILRNRYGQLILGNEDPVAELMTASYGNGFVSFAGQNMTYDLASWIPVPSSFTSRATISAARAAFIEAPDNNDSSKIVYVTPRFHGFQAGISYAPEYRNQQWDGNGSVGLNTGGGAADTNRRLLSKDLLHDIWSIGLNYDSPQIGDIKIGVAAGYIAAAKPTMAPDIITNPTAGSNRPGYTGGVREFGGGMRVDMGGFLFTVGYKHLENSAGQIAGFANNIIQLNNPSLLTQNSPATTLFSTMPGGASADGYGVNTGVMFSWGANSVSWNGRYGTEKGCVTVTSTGTCSYTAGIATTDKQTVTGSVLSYARHMAPGIKWTANWHYAAYEDQKERDIDNHGNAITTAIRLQF